MKYKTHREQWVAWVSTVPVEVGNVSSKPPGILYVVLQRLSPSFMKGKLRPRARETSSDATMVSSRNRMILCRGINGAGPDSFKS